MGAPAPAAQRGLRASTQSLLSFSLGAAWCRLPWRWPSCNTQNPGKCPLVTLVAPSPSCIRSGFHHFGKTEAEA